MILLTSVFAIFVEFIGYQVVSFGLLFLVSILALFYGTGPILLAAITECPDLGLFLHSAPIYTCILKEPEDMLMLIMFFIIALLNGILTSRVRNQEKKIRIREERTHALYQLSKELANAPGIEEVIEIAVKYIQKYFNLDCAIFLKNDLNQLEIQVWNETRISNFQKMN